MWYGRSAEDAEAASPSPRTVQAGAVVIASELNNGKCSLTCWQAVTGRCCLLVCVLRSSALAAGSCLAKSMLRST